MNDIDPEKTQKNQVPLEETAPVALDNTSPVKLDDTSPVKVRPAAASTAAPKLRIWMVVVGGIILFLLVNGLSGLAGYSTGNRQIEVARETQVAQVADEQFQLGVKDFEAGQYALARQRFEYIISIAPDYPDVAEKLAEVMLAQSITATPTLVPTAIITPTPDVSIGDDAFNRARQLYASQDWTGTIEALDTIRLKNPTFRVVDVDGMYYMAYRNRGWNKIITDGNLEGGLYDFSMAEKYGVLDGEANGMRTWARLYIYGASYWDLDWARALEYFSQVTEALPNLRDSSNMTAQERFRVASIRFGDQLLDAGNACDAYVNYKNALALSNDPDLKNKTQDAKEECYPPTEEPKPTPSS